MRAQRVAVTGSLAYWTVVDDEWRPVPVADAYLRYLRLGADRAEGTTRVYAGDLALFLAWCHSGGRDRPAALDGSTRSWLRCASSASTLLPTTASMPACSPSSTRWATIVTCRP